MVCDTDVLIWALRGNLRAARAIDRADARSISVVSLMELFQGARDKADLKAIQSFLTDLRFQTLPLTENVGHRASIYMEEYVLAISIRMADALIAATAVENRLALITANRRPYRAVRELEIKTFRP
jgi:hypothetical protein